MCGLFNKRPEVQQPQQPVPPRKESGLTAVGERESEMMMEANNEKEIKEAFTEEETMPRDEEEAQESTFKTPQKSTETPQEGEETAEPSEDMGQNGLMAYLQEIESRILKIESILFRTLGR